MQLFKIWQDPPPALAVEKVAARYVEAKSLREWLYWMAQPFKVIWKHHQEFVQGPVDDAMDAIIKELAPRLVKSIVEHEVDSDVDEFIEGANLAAKGSPMPSGGGPRLEGYVWGKANPDDVLPDDLPVMIKRQVVGEILEETRHKITEEVVVHLLEKSWHAINPVNTFKAIIAAVKKHGWKLGIAAALFELFELFEHFCLPSILVWLTGNPKFLASATLPIGEIIYAVVLRIVGSTPKELDKAQEDGHLDWFEQNFGPVRLARGHA